MSLFLCYHFYWCASRINLVTHWALSLLSLCLSFFMCGSSNPLPRVCYFPNAPSLCFDHCFYMYALHLVISVFRCWCFSLQIMSFSGDFSLLSSFHPYLTAIPFSHTFTPLQRVFFPFTCLPWLDISCCNSAHPSHLSLNGLSPTTISPCSHSSFPSLLSLSR